MHVCTFSWSISRTFFDHSTLLFESGVNVEYCISLRGLYYSNVVLSVKYCTPLHSITLFSSFKRWKSNQQRPTCTSPFAEYWAWEERRKRYSRKFIHSFIIHLHDLINFTFAEKKYFRLLHPSAPSLSLPPSLLPPRLSPSNHPDKNG